MKERTIGIRKGRPGRAVGAGLCVSSIDLRGVVVVRWFQSVYGRQNTSDRKGVVTIEAMSVIVTALIAGGFPLSVPGSRQTRRKRPMR